MVGVTDDVHQAAVLAEGGDPKDTVAGISPNRARECPRKSVPAVCPLRPRGTALVASSPLLNVAPGCGVGSGYGQPSDCAPAGPDTSTGAGRCSGHLFALVRHGHTSAPRCIACGGAGDVSGYRPMRQLPTINPRRREWSVLRTRLPSGRIGHFRTPALKCPATSRWWAQATSPTPISCARPDRPSI